jgi:WD40 repeat protein
LARGQSSWPQLKLESIKGAHLSETTAVRAGALGQVEPSASTQFFQHSPRPALVEEFAIMRGDRYGPLHQSEFSGHHETHGVSVPASRLWFLRPGLVLKLILLGAVLVCLMDLWDVKPATDANMVLGIHPGKVMAVASSPDGKWLASGGYNSPVTIWNFAARRIETSLEGSPVSTFSLAFAPDGSILAAAGTDGTLRIWGTHSWTRDRVVQADSSSVCSLAFAPDGKSLATAGVDGIIALWDTSSWQARKRIQTSEGSLKTVAFSPDGRQLASLSANGVVRLWEFDLGETGIVIGLEARPDPMYSCGLAFSPDGQSLAIPRVSQPIELWDPGGGRRLATLGKPQSRVLSLTFSPDGQILALGTVEGAIELWNVPTRQRRYILRGHSGGIWSLAYLPDGYSLVSAGYDATLRLSEMKPREASDDR